MGQTLAEIAQQLKDSKQRVQLIYAFNGVGKTRLSREFKSLVYSEEDVVDNECEEVQEEDKDVKMLYYNAYTEDLFYWDNDLNGDRDRKLKIQPNYFTDWVLKIQGQAPKITSNFQRYTSDKLTPIFSADFDEITFSIAGGNNETLNNVKVSKGEESNLIWCIFYSLLEQVLEILNAQDLDYPEPSKYDNLECVFIDDPVSSLDDGHLIELAVDIAQLVKSSTKSLKYVITTHNPLFYNVLYNEFNSNDSDCGFKVKESAKNKLVKLDDGTYQLVDAKDSPFAYHTVLLSELETAIATGKIERYHFNFLRSIFEKLSTFLGYSKWTDLLPEVDRKAYYKRIMNYASHSKQNEMESSDVENNDKKVLKYLVRDVIIDHYKFKSIIEKNKELNNGTK